MNTKYNFEISPHKDAPDFSSSADAKLKLQQLFSEVSTGNFPTTEKFLSIIKQASLVNLWFFLKFVAGYSGPYNLLNTNLHLDMCNFRQSGFCMNPGSRFAMFLGRGHYKSTVGTHGANTWEIIRNPDIRIGLFNAVHGKAMQFFSIMMNTFKSNQFFKAVFPQFVINKNQGHLIVPCRSRKFSEPNVKVMSVGGASAGDHFDLADMDDIVSEQDVDAMGTSMGEMEKKKVWFGLVENSILISPMQSRLGVKGTRYAIDDPYQKIFNSCKTSSGYQDPDICVPNDFGKWNIYYRSNIENGEVTFPESWTIEKYNELLEDDPRQYYTQYVNHPIKSGLTEFYKLDTHRAKLGMDSRDRYYILKQKNNNFSLSENQGILLNNCDLVMAIDPAFTDSGISSKTSRTAIGIWAMDYEEDYIYLWERAGYYSIIELLKYIVEGAKQFNGYLRKIVVESNAAQKALKPIIQKELYEAGLFVGVDAIPVTKDKDVRIRSDVGRVLMQNKVFLVDGVGTAFLEEKNVFPQSQYKKDVLDMSQKAIQDLRKPFSPEEEYELDEAEMELQFERNDITGY